MNLNWWRAKKLEAELEEEVQSHLKMAAGERLERGDSVEEAGRAARREFGNVELVKGVTRDRWGSGGLSDVASDIRYGLRMLRKNIGFTAVAVLTLALGIGANTAIFSVVDAVLLKPLPYPEAGRLIYISQTDIATRTNGAATSFTKYEQIRAHSRSLESVAACYALPLTLLTEREPEAIRGMRASADFFAVLGVAPARGRTFLPEEDAPGGPDVAIVSDAFWHSYFGGEEGLLGRTVTLDGRNVTVVGILPKSFQFPLQFPEPQVWLPRVFENAGLRPEQVRTGAGYLAVIGRLRGGQELPAARSELATIDAGYRSHFGSYVDATKLELTATSLEENLVGTLRRSLLVLLAAVGFVLLIACVNVANLLLARATAREREIAIRKALGASRLRLVRQLLVESVLLSLAGGLAGVLLCAALMPSIRAFQPGAIPRLAEATIDGGVLLFSLGLCLLTGVIFGLAPSLETAQRGVQASLQEGSRGSVGGRGGRFRSLLVVAEIAMALVLMTGAGLLLASFSRLVRVNPGFTSANLTTFPVSLAPNRYGRPEKQAEFYRLLLEKVKSIPEVQSAGVTSYLPLAGAVRLVFFCPEGRACEGIGKDPTIALRQVSPGYFDTMRTPLFRGRVFGPSDLAGGSPVVVVNETTANRYWPGQDPIGKRLANSRDMIQREVVGVVADVKYNALNTSSTEEMYLPLEQSPWPATTLIVRSTANSQALVAAVRAKFAELDPTLPVSGILSMDDVVAGSVAQPRIVMQFAGVFSGFALLLAGIGIYGVMAFSVTQRRQEIGIRAALGARPADILQLVVGQGMRLTLAGVAAGVALSLLLTRLLGSLLFGVDSLDVTVFAAAAAVLVVAALMACLVPARRAMKVAPMVALRYE